jgi:hypothetical protein
MTTADEERNKAFVLEAFDTLFNLIGVTTPRRSGSGRPITSSTARTSSRDETACSGS